MNYRSLTVLFCTMFLIGTDTFIISPLLPALRELYHASTTEAGWLVAAYALGYALFALVAGPLSDNWNRKRVMTFGMLGFAFATIACGFADQYAAMFAFRFLAGVCSAFVGPQVWASVPILFSPAQIAKAMGIVMTGLTSSQFVGVPLGSFLAAADISFPFLAVGAASLLLCVFIARSLPDLPPVAAVSVRGTAARARSIWTRYRDLLAVPGASRYFFAYYLLMTGFYAFFSLFGIWLSDQFGQSTAQIGVTTVFIGLGNTVGSLVSGWAVERWGRKNALAASFLTNALVLSVLPHVSGLTFVQVLLTGMFCLSGMLVPILMGLLQTLSASSRGTISSLANACMYAGTLTGSALAGGLYSSFGFFAVTMLSIAGTLFASLLFLRKPKSKPVGVNL